MATTYYINQHLSPQGVASGRRPTLMKNVKKKKKKKSILKKIHKFINEIKIKHEGIKLMAKAKKNHKLHKVKNGPPKSYFRKQQIRP